MKKEHQELGVQESKDNIPNIAMADTLMNIFGFHRVSPTDKELEEKYKGDNKK